MQAGVRALLVHDEERPVAELKPLLESQGIETLQARSCAEAEATLACIKPPILIFTDILLADGTWADVQSVAERLAVPVIVVSRFVDIPLYLEALENGVADFIIPPFHDDDLAFVIQGALWSRAQLPSDFARATTGTRLEVTQHAQNHPYSGVRAAHAQAGR